MSNPLFFIMRLVSRLLTTFYYHLYHNLAFTYDVVAAVVSLGHWVQWSQTTLGYIQGTRVLEIGHGPGQLLKILLESRSSLKTVVGLDESLQMGRITRRRLIRSGIDDASLIRGLAQSLPFQSESFDSVVSSFPAEYILNSQTLREAIRVLCRGGRLIVLPAAWPKNPILKWLYRITGESPLERADQIGKTWTQPLEEIGFRCQVEIIETQSATILILIATKE